MRAAPGDADAAAARFVAAAADGARRLGLFDAVADPLPAGALAARLGAGPRRVAALVELLVASGHLVRSGGGLSAGTPPPAGAVPGGRAVAEVLRRDRCCDARDGWSLQLDARALPAAALLSPGSALAVAERLAARFADGGHLLDAGGGMGDVTDALLRRAPRAEATLVDRPEVIAGARARLAAHGPRVHFLEGDLFELALPSCDVALLSHVLHLHDTGAAARLVQTLAGSLRPGGLLAVREVAVSDDRAGSLRALAFGLAAAIHDDRAELHDAGRLVDWLEGAGLVDVRREDLAGAPEQVLVVGARG